MLKDAILILCHNDFPQIKRMIEFLGNEYFDYFIHIDANSRENKDIISCLPRVRIISPSIKVEWGRFSIVDATLRLLQTADRTGPYRYYHLLSGQCLPLKTSNSLYNYFTPLNGQEPAEYIECHKLPWENWDPTGVFKGGLNHIRIYYPSFIFKCYASSHWSTLFWKYLRGCNKLGIYIPSSILNKYGPFYGGSEWFSLTQKTISFMLDYVNKHPGYIRFFRHTFIPDESFFQTLFSKITPAPENKGMTRFIKWPTKKASSPTHLLIEDLSGLRQCGMPFARKFLLSPENLEHFFIKISH